VISTSVDETPPSHSPTFSAGCTYKVQIASRHSNIGFLAQHRALSPVFRSTAPQTPETTISRYPPVCKLLILCSDNFLNVLYWPFSDATPYTATIQTDVCKFCVSEGIEVANDPAEAYEKILTGNLQRALDFLKFAEAKNAALLALASAWIAAMLNLECSGHTLPRGFAISIPVALLCAFSAAFLAMVSFLPRLHLPAFLGGKRSGPHPPSLLYFGDISTLPIKTLEHELPARYLSSGAGYRDEYIHDLIVQLSVNSEIAMRKMLLFRWGMRLILTGGIVLFLPSLGLAFATLKSLW